MAKCSASLFNQQRKFQGFTFPSIFKIQEVAGLQGGAGGRHFVIWGKGHLFFIFQKSPIHTVQVLLGTTPCLMSKSPMVFINIYDTRLTMLYIPCFAGISHGLKLVCAQSKPIVDVWSGILARGERHSLQLFCGSAERIDTYPNQNTGTFLFLKKKKEKKKKTKQNMCFSPDEKAFQNWKHGM